MDVTHLQVTEDAADTERLLRTSSPEGSRSCRGAVGCCRSEGCGCGSPRGDGVVVMNGTGLAGEVPGGSSTETGPVSLGSPCCCCHSFCAAIALSCWINRSEKGFEGG